MFSDRSNPWHLNRPLLNYLHKKTTACARPLGLLILAITFCLIPLSARKHQHWGEELSVDVEAPYEGLVSIVQEVSQDAIIRGTWQYKGTTELDAATASKTAPGFETWKGQGTVLYKVRPGTLAPEHFHESGDQGTVSVAILWNMQAPISPISESKQFLPQTMATRLHQSDGAVENAEYAEISRKLQDGEDRSRKQREEEVAKHQQIKSDELRVQLEQDRAELQAIIAKKQRLENELNELNELKDTQKGRPARIRTASADLKTAPYNQSTTVRLLSRGEGVTVIQQTEGWCSVKTGSGEQGWVYRLMLEVPQ